MPFTDTKLHKLLLSRPTLLGPFSSRWLNCMSKMLLLRSQSGDIGLSVIGGIEHWEN